MKKYILIIALLTACKKEKEITPTTIGNLNLLRVKEEAIEPNIPYDSLNVSNGNWILGFKMEGVNCWSMYISRDKGKRYLNFTSVSKEDFGKYQILDSIPGTEVWKLITKYK